MNSVYKNRTWLFLTLLCYMSCKKNADQGPHVDETGYLTFKGLFELQASDFSHHETVTLTPASITAQTSELTDNWRKTTVQVQKDDIVYIEAQGSICVTDDLTNACKSLVSGAPAQSYDPEGDSTILSGFSWLLGSQSPFALFGGVGDNIFRVGTGLSLPAPADGSLFLAINTCDRCKVQGHYVVVHTQLKSDVVIKTEPKITDNTITNTIKLIVPVGNDWTRVPSLILKKGEKVFITAEGEITIPQIDLVTGMPMHCLHG